MSTQESQIKNLITTMAAERGEIAGSILGSLMRKEFGVDMKNEYGGLKRFIRERCAGEVEWVRKKGGDDIFKHVSNLQPAREIESVKEGADYRDERFESPWKVFNNPKIKKGLLLDTTTGQLNVRNDGEPVPENFIPIEKVTQGEHRQMAEDFLAELDESKREEFRQALAFENFWFHWSVLLRRYRNDGVQKKWLKWSDTKIFDLFESRLRLAALPDNIIDNAINILKHSLEQLVRPRQSYDSTSRRLETNDPLRNIIHLVIDGMSEEELRRIWLPIGLLADALKQTNRKG
ncbi:MAG: hypothetical protein QOH63_2172 [Acidobacteriota bacterium]|jgi:hypothetical protein|nr:hypothetical protein [Acidobacteriota bacterium]